MKQLFPLHETGSETTQKKRNLLSEFRFPYFLRVKLSYASATTSWIETNDLFSFPLRKVTTPSFKAYNV